MREVFDGVAPTYDEWYSTPLGRFAHQCEERTILRMARPLPGEVCLDIGCGTGIYLLNLARSGLHAHGVDPSASMLRVLQAKLEHEPPEIRARVHARVGRMESLPYEDNSFDLVLSVTAFEFVTNPAKGIKEAWRVTKPGGRLVVGVIASDGPWGRLYSEGAENGRHSLFKQARFYDLSALLTLLPHIRPRVGRALWCPPTAAPCSLPFRKIGESVGNIIRLPGASFLVARWDKPPL